MEKEENRKAEFMCAAAYVGPLGEHVFLGETKGTLTLQPQVPVKKGIPLSSVFKPEAYDMGTPAKRIGQSFLVMQV